MATIMSDVTTAIKSEVSAELGAAFSELAYVENVQKNSLRTSNDRYGVRPLAVSQLPGVTKFTTYLQTFELILTRCYGQSSIDDSEQVNASLELRALVFDVFKRLINNHAGLTGTVLNVTDLAMAEPEYLEEDKVAIVRATFNVTYRLTLI